jgi:lycopene beta-cyclase
VHDLKVSKSEINFSFYLVRNQFYKPETITVRVAEVRSPNPHYIITGSGCAGLSLLYSILKGPVLQTKKVLVLDKTEKKTNDRTCCYWVKGKGLFEPMVTHEWKEFEFLTSDLTKRFKLEHYSYKMIKGIDFYNLVLNFSQAFEHVTFKYENVKQIQIENDIAFVETEVGRYTGEYVFNSKNLFNPEINTQNSLLQQFEGWVIRTKKPSFNTEIGALMDFRLRQERGATFMYVLPTTAREALVEYTLFSEKVLDKEQYKVALENYIKDNLKIEAYEIIPKGYLF